MSLQYALLGLLSDSPMNGYAIKALFDESIAHVWQAELSQIYRELESLEKKGLLRSTIEPQADRPNKRLYEATETGRKAFMDWVTTVPESFAMPKRDEFMLRLFFGSAAGEDVVKEQFRIFIEEMRRVEESARGHSRLAERFPDDPRMARADQICREDRYCDFVRRRAAVSAAAVRSWAEECLAELEAGGGATPPPG
jgi:PadR family transcriptional regulator, regulatory protein AphA